MLVVLRSVTASVLLAAVMMTGCISDQGVFNNVEVSGYVRSAADSSAIPGALVMIHHSTTNTTDSNGYYEYQRTFPTPRGEAVELEITVTDIDGEENGVFVARDTLIVEENPEDELDLHFEVDFYVEVVDPPVPAEE